MPELPNYWSSDPALRVLVVADVRTCKIQKILECIHCNNNETMLGRDDPNYDKLYKVRPLVTKLKLFSSGHMNLQGELSIDESMIPFKGRSSLKQYMLMKPIKRGYKIWCLADSLIGFIVKFDMYTGKYSPGDRSDELTLSQHVVTKLTSVVSQSQRIVAFDNFFTILNLMNMLHDDGLYAVGTVRSNRKGLPQC